MNRAAGRIAQQKIDALGRFFSDFQAASVLSQAPRQNLSSLEQFFADFTRLRSALMAEPPTVQPTAMYPDLGRLTIFFDCFGPLAKESTRLGDFIDVWDVAGLERVELRNASIVAWLFDANQTHGRGPTILNAFVQRVAARHYGKFPIPTSGFGDYFVLKEAYLLDNSEYRVDIAIEGNCVMIVEVKIDARPNESQIRSYLDLAKAKAGDREYCVILLACVRPSHLSIVSPRFAMATWKDLSRAIEDVVVNADTASRSFGDRLLVQFARYVGQL